MDISICLLTCDRPEFTEQTLRTLAEHNDLSRFALLHGDDASTKPHNRKLAKKYGFRNVYQSTIRKGCQTSKRELCKQAKTPYVLLLENDWESVREFPWDVWDQVCVADVYTFRLIGKFKERGKRRVGVNHCGRNDAPAGWQDFCAGAQIGDIHWTSCPSVTRHKELMWLLQERAESGSMRKSGEIQSRVVRMVDNVFYHIGSDRTPGFLQ